MTTPDVIQYVGLITAARPVIQGFESQFVEQGRRASVKCTASGNPTPSLQWHLDGEPLQERSHLSVGDFRTASGDVVSYVNISRVTLQEGGDYVCTASNDAGVAVHLSRLNVYGKFFSYCFLYNMTCPGAFP